MSTNVRCEKHDVVFQTVTNHALPGTVQGHGNCHPDCPTAALQKRQQEEADWLAFQNQQDAEANKARQAEIDAEKAKKKAAFTAWKEKRDKEEADRIAKAKKAADDKAAFLASQAPVNREIPAAPTPVVAGGTEEIDLGTE